MTAVRNLNTIKSEIEATGKITRQDIYEVLIQSDGETIEDKRSSVVSFLDNLPADIKNKDVRGKLQKDVILADLHSYLV